MEIVEAPPPAATASIEVFHPVDGGPWPIVVLAPGGGWSSADLASTRPLARFIAGSGYVVVHTSYRLTAPEAFADIECAVRIARNEGATWGGDPQTVLVAGHSAGAHVTVVATLGGAGVSGEGCPAPASSQVPDGWLGIAGVYDMRLTAFFPAMYDFFGGSPEDAPDAWRNGDPLTYLDRQPQTKFSLIHGSADPVAFPALSRIFAGQLADAGIPVTISFVDGADHSDIIDPNSDGRAVVAALDDLVAGL